ncbi:MAG: hypothetical protein GOV01_00900 [Candidatus Altiarchaeota archaeon]|nr:hypothetical protein [Candidatus Altiarchaeota archaeon]
MPTTSIHYVPLLLVQTISGLILLMIGWKIAGIIANPAIYLQPAVEAAARDVAIVCDDKLTQKTLPAPPPGSSYLIMDCLTRTIASGTSSIIMMGQIAKAAYDLKGIPTSLFKKGGKIGLSVEGLRNLAKRFVKDGDKIILKAEYVDEYLDIVQGGKNALDEAADLKKGIKETFKEGIPDEVVQQASKAEGKADAAYDTLTDMEKSLEEAKKSGKNLEIDCKENRKLCESFQYAPQRMESAGTTLSGLYDSAVAAAAVGVEAIGVSKRVASAVKGKQIIFESTALGNVKLEVLSMIPKITGVRSALSTVFKLRAKTVAIRHRLIYPVVRGMIYSNQYDLDLGMEYLEENEDFYELLYGSFVGVKYTPYMINLMNDTSDEVIEIYNESLLSSSKFSSFGSTFKSNATTLLGTLGYYETSSYIYDSELEKLIKYGYETNLDPTLYAYAATEYVNKVGKVCENDEECGVYLADVLNESINVMWGEASVSEFRNVIENIPEESVQSEETKFTRILDFFEEAEKTAEPIMDDVFRVQQRTATWMGDNCEVDTLEYSTGPVQVTTCGMVVDCSPGDMCYIGIPVVSSDPWIPYIPVSLLEGNDVAIIAKLSGLNYDSAQHVVTPTGWFGCDWDDHKMYICASLSSGSRCLVVDCGKLIVTIPDNFNPEVTVRSEGDQLIVGGNFLTW